MRKRILVTGGAGFLGSALVSRAVAEGWDVTVFDDLSRGTKTEGPFRFVRGDVNVARDVEALERADLVVHCAALCGVERCLENPARVIADFAGTANICRYALRHGVERVLFVSSGEVYGSRAINAREEDDVVLWNTHVPRTNYALSKLMGEATVRTLPMSNVTVRPFNVFGDGQNGPSAVRNFMRWALEGEPLRVYNGGHELRAMCYIDDFTDGCFSTLTRPLRHQTYNIGNPFNTMSVNRVAETVLRVTGSKSAIQHVEKSYPDKHGVTPNIDRAASDLEYAPRVSLEEGLVRMLHALRPAVR